jgi:anaerobic ribonucleoside-triphosphate reductase activating protein
MSLYYSNPQQTFQDVPDEISLALSISGCKLRCMDCHSKETYPANYGYELTIDELDRLLKKFRHTTCVLFYGGEWDLPYLIELITHIKNKGLKCCLYTGMPISYFTDDFIHLLDFIKIGHYIKKMGALNSPHTNQKFFEINQTELVDKTHLFQK